MMRLLPLAAALALLCPIQAQADPQPMPSAPFVATLSNTAPLHFGLTPEQTAAALGAPLAYVSGRRGHEIFLAVTTGGHFFARSDAIFLQFRRGRLTGWKADRRMAGTWWW